MKKQKIISRTSEKPKDTKQAEQSLAEGGFPLGSDIWMPDCEMRTPAEEDSGPSNDGGTKEPVRHATFLDQALAEKGARERRKEKRKKKGQKTKERKEKESGEVFCN